MLMIRLSRIGRKKRPSYRVVVQEKRQATNSTALEIVGSYNPLTHPATFSVKEDRVRHWIGHGAQVSDTLWNLFVERKIVSGEKRKITRAKKNVEGEQTKKE